MAIDIRPVRDPNSRLGRAFFMLPFGLYQEVPQWVPQLHGTVRSVLTRKHPFFEHSTGEAFVMLDGNTAVARYLLLSPDAYNAYRGVADARIGMLEAIDREEVWDAVVEHAREWAGRRNADRIIAPQTFSPMDGAGVLVEGFDHRASMTMMPYTPPFYQRQYERLGFEKLSDSVSLFRACGDYEIPEKIQRVARLAELRSDLRVEHPERRSAIGAVAREVAAVYNRAWSEHENFRPLTTRETAALASDLSAVVDPGLVTLLRAPDDTLVGFVLPFPDVSAALQRSGGRLGLRTVLDLWRERRRSTHCIVNGLGVLPEYHNRGGTALLYTHLTARIKERGFRTIEMTQIAESTRAMLAEANTIGGTVYKRHRIYQLPPE